MKTISKSFRLVLSGLAAVSLVLSGCSPNDQDRVLTEEEFGTAVAATVNAAISQTPPSQTLPASQTPTPTRTEAPTAVLLPSSTPMPTRTPVPSLTVRPSATLSPVPPTATATPVTGLIFEDDFSTQTGWSANTGDGFALEYVDGAYRMTINRISGVIYSVRMRDQYTDLHLEVDAALTGGPENGYYGVICRYQDGDNYYALMFGSDGFYTIARMFAGQFTYLNRGKNLTGVISGPGIMNRVQADCSGKYLSLYANGTLLARVEDASIPTGGFGLVVGTRPSAGAQITFDNILVSQPNMTPTPSPTP